MIVLPSISQTVFTIDDTRYTCYNNSENRMIARIFLSEEYANIKFNTLQLQNDKLIAINNNLKDKISLNDMVISEYQFLISDCNKDNNNLKIKHARLQAKIDKYKPYIISSAVLNLVFITILVL